MTLDELKGYVINKVQSFGGNKNKILLFKVFRNGDKEIWNELLFWHPGEYVLFASRTATLNTQPEADGSIGPFTINSNHRDDWKNCFFCIDRVENGTKWAIAEEKIIEMRPGSDEKGFYYYPIKH